MPFVVFWMSTHRSKGTHGAAVRSRYRASSIRVASCVDGTVRCCGHQGWQRKIGITRSTLFDEIATDGRILARVDVWAGWRCGRTRYLMMCTIVASIKRSHEKIMHGSVSPPPSGSALCRAQSSRTSSQFITSVICIQGVATPVSRSRSTRAIVPIVAAVRVRGCGITMRWLGIRGGYGADCRGTVNLGDLSVGRIVVEGNIRARRVVRMAIAGMALGTSGRTLQGLLRLILAK
ncbi:hypothetical protein C8R47DRAFT_1117987 [Mycena vitilis]|nr:hypothetical protein C8R47DRAFT_1117987 [Mycena vitilis]